MRFSFGSTTSAVRPSKRAGRGLGLVLSVVFLVVGGVLAYFFLVRPVGKVLAARAWPAVPCVVESSEVREHSGDDGPSYSVEIAYRYEFAGREWKATRYDFMGGSSSGRRGKSEIVALYPPRCSTASWGNSSPTPPCGSPPRAAFSSSTTETSARSSAASTTSARRADA